jgi:hypothetical protein
MGILCVRTHACASVCECVGACKRVCVRSRVRACVRACGACMRCVQNVRARWGMVDRAARCGDVGGREEKGGDE